MKVILLKGVQKLGKRLDIVNVADGFAMNNLFPNKLAELATPDSIKRAEKARDAETAEKKVREDLLIKNLKGLEGTTITLSGKANDKGHLFAGIHKEELIAALKEQGHIDMDAEHILLDKPLKDIGDNWVNVKVQDKDSKFKVVIEAL